MHTAQRLAGLSLVIIAAVISDNAVPKNPDPQNKIAKRKIEQTAQHRQARGPVMSREELRRHYIDAERGALTAPSFNGSILRDASLPRSAYSSASVTPPPPSPGVDIGFTSYDMQAFASQGYQVARTPTGTKVHFTWMAFKYIPTSVDASDRYVLYSPYLLDCPPPPIPCNDYIYNGIELTGASNRAGFPSIDVNGANRAHVALHQAANDYTTEPYTPWHYRFPYASNTFFPHRLTGYDNSCPDSGTTGGGILWPRLTADRGDVFVHEIAHSNTNYCAQNKLWYWRFDGDSTWEGPALLSNTPEVSYVIAADAGSDKVAVVTHRQDGEYMNVEYIESQTNGSDWLALIPNVDPMPTPTPITSYGPPYTHTAGFHLASSYDNSGVLHVMWDELEDTAYWQRHDAIKHWNSSRNTIRTVALGYWDNLYSNGVFEPNLSKLTMGIGDGSTMCGGESNNNYVYATYTQFGGLTEAERDDHSSEYSYEGRLGGFMNGEIYVTISNTGGNTWSPPVNLTNTKTPNCNPGLADPVTGEPANWDSVCRSEHWASIGRVVKDIDVFFVSDIDPGAIPYMEGSWQLNPVHYLQISGSGVAPAGVCPLVAPHFEATLTAAIDCPYHANQTGSDYASLTIMNLGMAELLGDISVTDFPGPATLEISNSGGYTIPPESAALIKTVTMRANGATEGVYTGSVDITHNDPSKPSPHQFSVELFVYNVFYCDGCCPCQYDPNCDGIVVSVLDVVETVNVAFRNEPGVTDALCAYPRTDVDADGATTVTDVVKVINVAFRNQTVEANFVDPCL